MTRRARTPWDHRKAYRVARYEAYKIALRDQRAELWQEEIAQEMVADSWVQSTRGIPLRPHVWKIIRWNAYGRVLGQRGRKGRGSARMCTYIPHMHGGTTTSYEDRLATAIDIKRLWGEWTPAQRAAAYSIYTGSAASCAAEVFGVKPWNVLKSKKSLAYCEEVTK